MVRGPRPPHPHHLAMLLRFLIKRWVRGHMPQVDPHVQYVIWAAVLAPTMDGLVTSNTNRLSLLFVRETCGAQRTSGLPTG